MEELTNNVSQIAINMVTKPIKKIKELVQEAQTQH
jgi:hypothetical protein